MANKISSRDLERLSSFTDIKPETEEERMKISQIALPESKEDNEEFQYKVTIPKKFAKLINLNPEEHDVVFYLEKHLQKDGKFKFEITAKVVGKDEERRG